MGLKKLREFAMTQQYVMTYLERMQRQHIALNKSGKWLVNPNAEVSGAGTASAGLPGWQAKRNYGVMMTDETLDFVVVTKHPLLVKYVDGLQKKNAEALSFYPTQVFEREAEKGRVFLGLLNGEPCGYLYAGAQGRDVKLHQVCIQYDARRRLYGAAIAAVMEQYAEDCKATSITLRCGFDLEANEFWGALGYVCIATQPGGVRRMRTINVWRKWLGKELFTTLAVEPAVGKVDASLWRKNKATGTVTQFVRGKAMQDYRAMLVSREEAKEDKKKDESKQDDVLVLSGDMRLIKAEDEGKLLIGPFAL